MIKNVDISEDIDKKFVTLNIECEESTGIKSIQVVCLANKVQESQELISKVMQMLSLPQRVTNAAVQFSQLFAATQMRK